jgi:uncharacterized membrane protein
VLGERRVQAVTVDGADDAAGVSPGGSRFVRALPVLWHPLRRALTAPPGSAGRDPVVWLIAALAFGAYFVISLYRLLTLTPSSYDLGIFTEFVRQLAQLHAPVVDLLAPGFNLEGDHFQVAVGVLAPFFRLLPTPATLLFFQALFTAGSVFPVATAASLLTGRSAGRLIGFAYAFSWGLQQMINFDFHEVALAVPLLAFSVSALVRRRPGAAIAWAVPLVFVKEDQGFTVAAIGALMMATAAFPSLLPARTVFPKSTVLPANTVFPKSTVLPANTASPARSVPGDYRYVALWGGVSLLGWGLFWSMFAITVIIPHFNPLHEYRYWGGAADGPVVGTVGGGPGSVGALLDRMSTGWPIKLTTVVMLLLPTAFAALGSPVALVALPSLVLRFISTDTSYWGTAWHYNATVMPILFIAAAEAIGRWRRAASPGSTSGPPDPRFSPSPLGPLTGARAFGARLRGRLRELVHPALTGAARHGGAMMAAIAVALAFQFPLSALWHGSTYTIDAHVAAADAAMAVVPDGATVTTTLDLLAPLAARTDTFWIGNSGNPVTQYVVFDGADSGYSPPVTNVPAMMASWFKNDGYVQVFAQGDVYVYRRG